MTICYGIITSSQNWQMGTAKRTQLKAHGNGHKPEKCILKDSDRRWRQENWDEHTFRACMKVYSHQLKADLSKGNHFKFITSCKMMVTANQLADNAASIGIGTLESTVHQPMLATLPNNLLVGHSLWFYITHTDYILTRMYLGKWQRLQATRCLDECIQSNLKVSSPVCYHMPPSVAIWSVLEDQWKWCSLITALPTWKACTWIKCTESILQQRWKKC